MRMRNGVRGISAHQVAKSLGWLSIGMGVMEILHHRRLSRRLGMPEKRGLLQAYGVREIVNGTAILVARNPAPWVWVRVAGDILDLATLGNGLQNSRFRRRNIMLAIGMVSAVTALDIFAAAKESGKRTHQKEPYRLARHPYHERSGFPRRPVAMRGIASDIEIPDDMKSFEFTHPGRRMAIRKDMGWTQQPI